MKKSVRIISVFLTVLMLLGGLAGLSVVEVAAADEETPETKLKKYLTTEYATPEDKLATMTLMLDKDGYQLWADSLSGEVAFLDKASGQILFTNPYDVATTKGSASTKEQIMSQIFVKYEDNGQNKEFNSFKEAGCRGQIIIKNIKGGIRVEYTIGREETRMLVPRHIRKERFETMILEVAAAQLGEDNFTYKKLKAYYLEKDPEKLTSERAKAELYSAFPITKKMPIYVFDPTASETELRKIEEIIKTYCPLYTYEELDKDHEETQYVGADRAPALFKMALEYTIDTDGLIVRLPANGIRFDESEYKLQNIVALPYMGAGANYAGSDKTKTQTGYTFFPDGSGSIWRFEDLANSGTTTKTGKIYGSDYAYQTITSRNEETVRYPAFGIVSNDLTTKEVKETDEAGNTTVAKKDVTVSRGYVAVIEEGDSLAEITTYHAGPLSKYNTVQMAFNPRPKDSYNMRDAISVGSNSEVPIVSKRKYVGSYKIRYFMLTDKNIAEEKGIKNYFETSWLGMAVAYREYLDKLGVLEKLTASDLKGDIPLYIETFGSIETVQKILSIPVNTKVALTSFKDVMAMYDKLEGDGISNINFKLTGYANGGMYAKVPYKLKWEKAVGGADDFKDLVAYSKEKGFGVYPEFDFVYVQNFGSFDGISEKKHLVKTIDNRYTSKREYSAMYQENIFYFQLAISPAYYSYFYEKFTKNYQKYDLGSISVSTLGSDLNSDFDEDEPYNREDSKQYTVEALKYFDENYDSVMVSGGNAYTWKYVDHILGVSLDSSRYNKSSNSVPFLGVMLHGYVQFAGSALNMEGNIGYAKLRTIENGAAPYFILSYDNTTLLKEDAYLSKYYSVRYDIWYDELVDIYKELNSVLKDVQTKLIISHEFLVGERVPDQDELEADIRAAEKKLAEELAKADADAQTQAIKDILTARQTAKNNAATIATLLENVNAAAIEAKASIEAIETALNAIPEKKAALDSAKQAEANALAVYNDATAARKDANTAYTAISKTGTPDEVAAAKSTYDNAVTVENDKKALYTAAQGVTKAAQTEYDAVDKVLVEALKQGTDANDTAVKALAQATELSAAANEASAMIATVADATENIKSAAAEYAKKAADDTVTIGSIAAQIAIDASVAIAISADRTIDALIATAEKAATTAQTRADDVNVVKTDASGNETTIGKYINVKKAEDTLNEANAARDTALQAYETAQAAYEEAKEKAALSTATVADKNAATEAGVAMNKAKNEYDAAAKNATAKQTAYNSAIAALKTSLQKVLDEQNKAKTAAAEVEKALADADIAAENLTKLTGISSVLTDAAAESLTAAKTNAEQVEGFVNTAMSIYAASADLVKDYVVIVEVVEEPEEETPAAPEDEDEDEEPENPVEEPEDDDNKGSQLYADYEYTKYTNDNGNIVKVTYGDPDGNGGYKAYKTFILNYNFFDVTVVLDGVTYTIPESGYVIFYH